MSHWHVTQPLRCRAASHSIARLSTGQQDFQTQIDKLEAAGAKKIFAEKRSGMDGGRPQLAECLRYLRQGDTLLVTKLDRLARSTIDLYRTVEALNANGVGFRVLDDATVDTTTRTGKLVLGILALIAEFETEIRKERQMEGIARAKAENRMGGRPRLITSEVQGKVLALRTDGMSIRKIAEQVGFSKASVQKIVDANKAAASSPS